MSSGQKLASFGPVPEEEKLLHKKLELSCKAVMLFRYQGNEFDLSNPEDPFVTLIDILNELRAVQKRRVPHLQDHFASGDLSSRFAAFEKWIETTSGVKTSEFPVKVADNLAEGNGMVATKDIKVDDTLFRIPTGLFMSEKTACESLSIAWLRNKDQLCAEFPSVVLGLHVMQERLLGASSKWAPYLDVLPSSYDLAITYSVRELNALRPSFLYGKAVDRMLNLIRQFCYLWEEFELMEKTKDTTVVDPPVSVENFTYENFEWAMCTVLSRQNAVPSSSADSSENQAPKAMLALVPFYDMVNHAEGEMKTFFNPKENAIECAAMHDAKPNEQVFMCYGVRNNLEFLLYQGFVYGEHKNDTTQVPFSIPEVPRETFEKRKYLVQQLVGEKPEIHVVVCRNGTVSPIGLQVLRICALKENEIPETEFPATFCQEPLSDSNEMAALLLLKTACEVQLERLLASRKSLDLPHASTIAAFKEAEILNLNQGIATATDTRVRLRKRMKNRSRRRKK
mmetsp:Transcript_9974/g.24887  ORF Transcript_9974/g.24887 Transcript_9974/m.24887 type:complete len:510 (+) Transcript_9974:67-1596(+)